MPYVINEYKLNGDAAGGDATHLALADHMHELDTGEDDAQAAEILEAHHRPDDAFDRTMVLFHNIVQVLPDPDRHFLFGVQGINGGQFASLLSMVYWRNAFSNSGTSLMTQRCTVEWSTLTPRSAIISSRLRRLNA